MSCVWRAFLVGLHQGGTLNHKHLKVGDVYKYNKEIEEGRKIPEKERERVKLIDRKQIDYGMDKK